MVSILQCPKTPKQVFVAKYLFLEQNKQIWDEPLCSGHLSIVDTFFDGVRYRDVSLYVKNNSHTSAVHDHMLFCKSVVHPEDFSILAKSSFLQKFLT